MQRSIRGFTLLELIVALAVFAVMSVAAYSGLRNVLFTQAALQVQQQRLADLQLAVYRLEQDISQAVARSIRDEYGDPQPAMRGGDLIDNALVLTRSGWDNPLQQTRAHLQRVAYRLQGGRLLRQHWEVLDRATQRPALELLLLDRVQQFEVRFMNQRQDWQPTWPPHDPTAPSAQRQHDLPRAVEITLRTDDFGTISRLFLLPN